jgi:malate dehydrogenase
MQHVAIVGAGELGGAVAHALARRDLARAITLVDERGRVADGKALDIAQAGPVEGFATSLAGAADLSAAAGAEIIVIADRFGAGEWLADDALTLFKQFAGGAARAIVVCAGALGSGLVDRGVREARLSRTRILGSAPEALAGGARAMVGLAADVSPRDVSLSVLGCPPHGAVIPWSDATIGGVPLVRVLDEPSRRRLDARVRALWPPGPFALAAAAVQVIAAIDGRSRQRVCCFVGPDLGSGDRTRTAALPVRLGPSGIAQVVVPSLSAVERVALENAMLL